MSSTSDMRFHHPLDSILQRPATVRVIRPLVLYSSREFTGRELAKIVRLSPQQTLRCLWDLEREGLVRGKVSGRSRLWSWRDEHVLAPELRRLVRADEGALSELLSVLRRAFEGARVYRVRVFGSVARGSETPASDIDLLVEADERRHPDLSRALADLVQDVYRRFGNTLTPLVIDPNKRQPPGLRQILEAVEREGIDVIGGRDG